MSNIEVLRQFAYEGRHQEAMGLASGEVEWAYVIDHCFDSLIVDEIEGDGRGVASGHGDTGCGNGPLNCSSGYMAGPGAGAGAAFADGSGLGTGLEERPASHDILTAAGFRPMVFSESRSSESSELLDDAPFEWIA